MPAQAIIAALSLHKFGGGKIEVYFFSSANFIKFFLANMILKDYKNLPYVFGNKDEFKIFYNNLTKINFPKD